MLTKLKKIGKIKAMTTKKTKGYNVFLKLDYNSILNLTWNHGHNEKIFQTAPTPYKIIILNNGTIENLINIDFSEG